MRTPKLLSTLRKLNYEMTIVITNHIHSICISINDEENNSFSDEEPREGVSRGRRIQEHSDSLGNSKEEHTIFFRKDVITYQTTKEGTFVSTSKYRKDKSIRPSLDGMLNSQEQHTVNSVSATGNFTEVQLL